MCSRFYLAGDRLQKTLFGIDDPVIVSYNTAPTDGASIVLPDEDGDLHAVAARWGLKPPWSKFPLINAKVETVLSQGAFKEAFAERRCLVPASGFFEWETTADKQKLPHMFGMRDASQFAFAGFYTEIKGAIEFCILTTEPNELVEPVHNRMPVIVAQEDFDHYLRGKAEDAREIATPPFPAERMREVRVNPRINSSKYKEPDAVEPL